MFGPNYLFFFAIWAHSMVSFPPSATTYTKPTTIPRLMHNGPNDIFLPQAQHEAQSLLHLPVQRELHHHQGQPAPLPGLSSQALHRHRHDERVWVDFGCICPPSCSQAVEMWAHAPCLYFVLFFFTTVFYFCLQSLLQKKKKKIALFQQFAPMFYVLTRANFFTSRIPQTLDLHNLKRNLHI